MDKFEIGEIVIFCGKEILISKGTEVEICSERYTHNNKFGYDIKVPGHYCDSILSINGEYFCAESSLRKKQQKRKNQDIEKTRDNPIQWDGNWNSLIKEKEQA